ncbi:MAG: CBS domain-containing protein [Deltaproteobacteria bacterium]|nr:CBS domain-containing protein [Deltaproteobacteria bacterium]
MKVEKIMNAPVVSCREDQTLNDAAHRMWSSDLGVVPVLDGEGRLVGMVTDRDVCMSAYFAGRDLSSIPLARAMSRDVVTCRADEELEVIEERMGTHQIRRLPVVDDEDHPIGMISLADLARFALAARKKNGLDREISQTLARICRPPAEDEVRPVTTPRARTSRQRATL